MRAVVNDFKERNTSTGALWPSAVSYNDYYTFGMMLPGRKFTSENYRYGFNGQEKSDEIKGAGNSNTATFWEYDTRLGRRWNVDPVINPNYSSYAALGGNPIVNIDPKGDSWEVKKTEKDGKTTFDIKLTGAIYDKTGSVDLGKFKESVESQLAETYNTKNIEGGENVEVNISVSMRVITDPKEAKPEEHILTILSDQEFKNRYGDQNGVGDLGGLKVFIPQRVANDVLSRNNRRTISHEFDHTAGLYHPSNGQTLSSVSFYDLNDQDNLMHESLFAKGRLEDPNIGIKLKLSQIQLIYSNYLVERLNQDTKFTLNKKITLIGSPLVPIIQVSDFQLNYSIQNWVSFGDRFK